MGLAGSVCVAHRFLFGVKILTGVFRGSPALRAGTSETNHEIKLNYREAPRCERGASLYKDKGFV